MGFDIFLGNDTTHRNRVGTVEGDRIYNDATTSNRNIVATIDGNRVYRGPTASNRNVLATVDGNSVYEGTSTVPRNQVATIDGGVIYEGTTTAPRNRVAVVEDGATPVQVGAAAASLLLLHDTGEFAPDDATGGSPHRSQGSDRRRRARRTPDGSEASADAGRSGQDLRTELEVSLAEAASGVEKRVTIDRPSICGTCGGRCYPSGVDTKPCPACNGTGTVGGDRRARVGGRSGTETCKRCAGDGTLYAEVCADCDGEGYVVAPTTLTVEVPAGIRSGQTLRMEREGAPSAEGGPRGDLLIDVSVTDHDAFDREGADLTHRLSIPFQQAIFGGTVAVPTVDGAVQLEVPEGTQTGDVFRLEGKGMAHLRGQGRGDLFVRVEVALPDPEGLTVDQREALEAYVEAVDGDGGEGDGDRTGEPRAPDGTVDRSGSKRASIDRIEVPGVSRGVQSESDRGVNSSGSTSANANANANAVPNSDPKPDSTSNPTDPTPTDVGPSDGDSGSAPHSDSDPRERIAHLEDSLERTKRDFREYKQRAEKRRTQAERKATEDLLLRFVDVRDDLHRALAEESGDVDALREGVRLTLKNVDNLLFDDDHLTEIDPEPGTAVDYERHEVVSTVDGPRPEGTVTDVHSAGYEMDGRVLRPARVAVSDGS